MKFFRNILLVCPAACLLAQTPVPVQLNGPKTVNPDGSVTMQIPIPAPVPPTPPGKVVLTVGDVTVTALQFDQMVDGMPDQYKVFLKGPGRKQFADQLVKVILLSQEGKRLKLDQSDAYKEQVKYQNEQMLATLAFGELSKNVNVDDQVIRAYYEAHKSDYEQFRARHILIRFKGSSVPVKPGGKDLTDAEALAKAQDLEKQLKAGEDFGKLAGAESDDTGSAINGGELGNFKHGQMVPPFEQAAEKLDVGQISEPVKSQFGYHIIKLEEKGARNFDEVKPEIEKKIRPEEAQKALTEMEKKANAVYDPAFFSLDKGPAPNMTPVPPPVKK